MEISDRTPSLYENAPVDRTVDGVEIRTGLRVFTNDCEWGTVSHRKWDEQGDGWWEVFEDRGRAVMVNGERLCCQDLISFTRDPHPAA